MYFSLYFLLKIKNSVFFFPKFLSLLGGKIFFAYYAFFSLRVSFTPHTKHFTSGHQMCVGFPQQASLKMGYFTV